MNDMLRQKLALERVRFYLAQLQLCAHVEATEEASAITQELFTLVFQDLRTIESDLLQRTDCA